MRALSYFLSFYLFISTYLQTSYIPANQSHKLTSTICSSLSLLLLLHLSIYLSIYLSSERASIICSSLSLSLSFLLPPLSLCLFKPTYLPTYLPACQSISLAGLYNLFIFHSLSISLSFSLYFFPSHFFLSLSQSLSVILYLPFFLFIYSYVSYFMSVIIFYCIRRSIINVHSKAKDVNRNSKYHSEDSTKSFSSYNNIKMREVPMV